MPAIWTARCAGQQFGSDYGQVAQLVEHGTENAGVGGSIPPLATAPAQPTGPARRFLVVRIRALASMVVLVVFAGACSRTASRVTDPQTSPTSGRQAEAMRVGPDGRVRWKVALEAGDDSPNSIRPIVDGDFVITTMGGELRRLSLASGEQVWRHRAGMTIYGAWLTGRRLLAMVDQVSTNGRVIAVDADTGDRLWEWRTPGRGLMGEQKVVDGTDLAVITSTRKLAVIDGATGRPRWEIDVKAGEFQSFDTVPGAVLYADSGTLTSYASKTGAVNWTALFSAEDRPIVVGDVVTGSSVGAPRGGPRQGLDVATGEVRWELPVDDKYDQGVVYALRESFLLAHARRQRISVIDAASGEVRWTADVGGPVVEGGGAIELGSSLHVLRYREPAVLAFDMASGRMTHRAVLEQSPDGPPELGGAHVLFASSGQAGMKLTAVRDGTVAWSVALPRNASRGPTGLDDGGAVIEVVDAQTGTLLSGTKDISPAPPR